MSKTVSSIRKVIAQTGLRDGMTISFHHHLRDGDYVLNAVMEEIANLGIRDLTVNASAILDVHAPLIGHVKNHVVANMECAYMAPAVGRAISRGVLETPVIFRSHGGRASDIESGNSRIDVAFVAASASDDMGNCSGKFGPSAYGAMGYAFADAKHSDKVVVITDNLVPYPLADYSIEETNVDYVVKMDKIGDPSGIVSGTTRITRDPVGLILADYAVQVIRHSGLLKDGFSFQTGAGGISLAVAKHLKDIMLEGKVHGSFAMGGITGYLVDMLHAGCFQSLMDVQCFDLGAVESIRANPRHREISAFHYAGPAAKSALVDSLDAVILGATQIDTDFNVNAHTDSNGNIIGGSGGHCDTAAGTKLSIITAPLIRARIPLIVDRVLCITTPGDTVDVLVTQRGVAVNPLRKDLRDRLSDAGLPVADIHDLKRMALDITGTPARLSQNGRVVADVIYRDGLRLDQIREVSH
jgi:citrate lyase subunit alpha/citrate CoA-transferase